jgi:imidazolonepropionase-like amidohydrolase
MLAIRAGQLIDGRGGDPVRDAIVLVDGATIEAVGPAGAVTIPAGAEVVDATGRTVMPGLIDCHVHITVNSWRLEDRLFEPRAVTYYQTAANLERTLCAGFTTIRDAGYGDAGIRQALEMGLIAGPRLVVSGMIGATGGVLDRRYPSGARIVDDNSWRICDGVEAVRGAVRRILAEDADFIKTFSTGAVGAPLGHPLISEWTPAELAVIVEEADRAGAGVMVHAEGPDGIKNALRAGVTSVEHGYVLDEEAIDLFLETGIYLVATLHIASRSTSGLTAVSARKKEELRRAQAGWFRRACEAGVKVALGSDAFWSDMHGTNAVELALMMEEGGLSAMDAIVAGTRHAADCCRLGDRVGTLEPGKEADLLLVDGDPLVDIHVLQDPGRIVVYQGGVRVPDQSEEWRISR